MGYSRVPAAQLRLHTQATQGQIRAPRGGRIALFFNTRHFKPQSSLGLLWRLWVLSPDAEDERVPWSPVTPPGPPGPLLFS